MTYTEFIALIAGIGGLLTGVAGLIAAIGNRKKTVAEVSDMASESVTRLLGPLNDRIDQQNKEIAELKSEAKAKEKEFDLKFKAQKDAFELQLKNQQEKFDKESGEMRALNGAMAKDIHNVQLENAELRAGVALLSTQVIQLGQEPMYQSRKRDAGAGSQENKQ